MTMAIAFDSLGYAKRLRDNGVDQRHAEAHAEAVRVHHVRTLTKSDLAAALTAQTLALTLRLGVMMTVGFGVLEIL